MDEIDNDEFMEELDEIDQELNDNVYPLIDAIEEEHHNHSAWFAVLITALHEMFACGWTPDELVEEVREHHVLFMEETVDEIPPKNELH